MNTLQKIFDYKKEELAEYKRRAPLSDLKAKARDAAPTLPFRDVLKSHRGRFAVIAEIKKRSPSKGLIRKDFDPVAIARDYRDHGAAALSVLTDEHFFGGHLDYLRQVRQSVGVPLLRKDFLWEPYQVYAAREAGADAILLIAAMLERSQIEDLMGLARELGLASLVEVHDEAECAAIRPTHADLVGINNRNLKTFAVDVETTRRLLPLLPSQAVKVSESGLESASVLEALKKEGVDAFLIGEAFMKAEKPGEALKKLLNG